MFRSELLLHRNNDQGKLKLPNRPKLKNSEPVIGVLFVPVPVCPKNVLVTSAAPDPSAQVLNHPETAPKSG